MDAAEAFEASVTVTEVGVADLGPLWEVSGEGERKRGGRGWRRIVCRGDTAVCGARTPWPFIPDETLWMGSVDAEWLRNVHEPRRRTRPVLMRDRSEEHTS